MIWNDHNTILGETLTGMTCWRQVYLNTKHNIDEEASTVDVGIIKKLTTAKQLGVSIGVEGE